LRAAFTLHELLVHVVIIVHTRNRGLAYKKKPVFMIEVPSPESLASRPPETIPSNVPHKVQRLFLRSTPPYASVTRTETPRGTFLVTALVSSAVVISVTTRWTISTISSRTAGRWTSCPRGLFVSSRDNLSRKMQPKNQR
jgi:hypothetical protein